jgi:hypothetical protein
MASETLDLLDAIVKGAEAASGKGAGQPLRAAEWNTLADAIARLARLAAAREKNEADTLAKTYARVDHEHLGQVGLTWLDPPTRALVEGRDGAADVVARLNDLARDTKALRTDITALTGQVDRLRDGLRDATDAQLVRDRATEGLGKRLDGVIDLDRRVTTITDGLSKMGTDVRAALDFRNTLVDPSGAPLDLRALSGRVSDLETSRDRLRLADGEVVRIRDFESRVANLEGRIVDNAILDTRIGQRLGVLVDEPDNPLASRAAAAAAAALDPRIAAVEAGVQTSRGDIETLQAQRTTDTAQIAGLGTRLDQQTARTDTLAASVTRLGALSARVANLETGLSDAGTRITGLEALGGKVTTLQSRLDGLWGLPDDTKALRRDLDAQGVRLDGVARSAATIEKLDSRLSAVEAATGGIGAFGNRLTVVEASLSALDGRVTVADAQINALSTVPNRVATLERNSADLVAWRRGVDERLSRLPDRALVDDLTTRLTSVETLSAAQQTRISQISGVVDRIGRNVVRPVVP